MVRGRVGDRVMVFGQSAVRSFSSIEKSVLHVSRSCLYTAAICQKPSVVQMVLLTVPFLLEAIEGADVA